MVTHLEGEALQLVVDEAIILLWEADSEGLAILGGPARQSSAHR
jgi:hypothetical protein